MNKALLLGAGFSYDLGMPLTYELTEDFLSIFNDDKIKSLAKIMATQKPYTVNRPINKEAITTGLSLILKYKKEENYNYEKFLADIQSLEGVSHPSQSDRDTYNYLFGIFYEIIHKILCLYQNTSYEILYEKNKKWFGNLKNLLSDKETWAFTLNHDLYLECLALDFSIPITYGDDQKIIFPVNNLDLSKQIEFGVVERKNMSINNIGFFKNARGINLVKLHGGLSELEYKDKSLLCNLRLNKNSSRELFENFVSFNEMGYYFKGKKVGGSIDNTITNPDGTLDIITKSMLTGGKKYSDTSKIKEGEEKLKILDDVLRNTDELTIIGYGFGDEHVNFRISNALLLNQNLRVTLVNPAILQTPNCIKQFDYDQRIKKAQCGAAHWTDYCKSQRWNEEQMKGLKENEKFRDKVKQAVRAQLKTMF